MVKQSLTTSCQWVWNLDLKMDLWHLMSELCQNHRKMIVMGIGWDKAAHLMITLTIPEMHLYPAGLRKILMAGGKGDTWEQEHALPWCSKHNEVWCRKRIIGNLTAGVKGQRGTSAIIKYVHVCVWVPSRASVYFSATILVLICCAEKPIAVLKHWFITKQRQMAPLFYQTHWQHNNRPSVPLKH